MENKARLAVMYKEEVVPALMKQFGYKNINEVPKLNKITLNMGLGDVKDNSKSFNIALEELEVIAGQKPVATRAKKAISNFKVREGMKVGATVTLRGNKMYEFLDRLIKLEKICHHFHLSLQSGCNETLKRMNRRYNIQEFEQIVENIRKYYKDAILTTDIIVGFPGESKEEFNQTYEFLKKIKFYKMHIFKYSQRKGTKAAIMPNQIDGSIKEERSKKLLELSDKNQKEYNMEYIGKEVEVLFEEKEEEFYKGHTKNYIEVKCKTNINMQNEIKTVKCKIAKTDYIIAEI